MFDIGSSEFLLIIVVAVLVIGPKDLPRALYKLGQVIGKARGMARHFRSGIDAMMREAELAELEKKWAAENRRIMDQHPDTTPNDETPGAMSAESPTTPGAATAGDAAPDAPRNPAAFPDDSPIAPEPRP